MVARADYPRSMTASPRSTTPIVRPGVPLAEYRARRERVLKSLGGAGAAVFAGDARGHGPFKAEQHFVYLTGITTEPGAVVLFNPAAEDPNRKVVLFLRPHQPETERWDRYREPISASFKRGAGFDHVMRTEHFPGALCAAARRCRALACLHGLAAHTSPVSPDLAVFREVSARVPGVSIADRSMLLNEMRSVKSAAEVAIMRRAAAATTAGYAAAMATLRPGVSERTVQRAIETAYLDHGAQGTAYDSIVGSGLNATVLHYIDNAAECRPGELLLIDSGARVDGYACDVTRTLPVNGRFTGEQRELYEIVLRAQMASIRAAKPGAFMWQVDKAARDIIDGAGLGDSYIHGIGHQLGIDVHDATPDGPLKPGMVITIEPGVYLPERAIGIRIEDSVLITRGGNEILTRTIPKTVAEVERAMHGGTAAGRRPRATSGSTRRRGRV